MMYINIQSFNRQWANKFGATPVAYNSTQMFCVNCCKPTIPLSINMLEQTLSTLYVITSITKTKKILVENNKVMRFGILNYRQFFCAECGWVRPVSRKYLPPLLSKEEAREVLLVDSFECVYCAYKGQGLQIDHIIPYIVGGSTTLDNLVVACNSCNIKRNTTHLKPMYGRFTNAPEIVKLVEDAIQDFIVNKFNFYEVTEALTAEHDMRAKADLSTIKAKADLSTIKAKAELSTIKATEVAGNEV